MGIFTKPKKSDWWFVWSSSRYDRSLESLEKAVRSYLSKSILHAGTEVSEERREKVLRKVARDENWGVLTGDKSYRDDTYWMWDKDHWECKHKGTFNVRSGPIYNARGNKMPDNTCTMALLVYKPTGHRLLVTALHPPSGVEGPGGLTRNLKRAKAWRIEYKAWKELWNKKAREWDADAILTAQDANVNIKRPLFQAMFKTMQPGMRLVTPKWGQKGGTHGGGRWIDIAFIRGKIRRIGYATLMRDDNSSDHRPWKVRMRFVRKPKSHKKSKPTRKAS